MNSVLGVNREDLVLLHHETLLNSVLGVNREDLDVLHHDTLLNSVLGVNREDLRCSSPRYAVELCPGRIP